MAYEKKRFSNSEEVKKVFFELLAASLIDQPSLYKNLDTQKHHRAKWMQLYSKQLLLAMPTQS